MPVLLDFPRCFFAEALRFLELVDGGVEGAEEGFGFGVELVALWVCEVGWRVFFGVGAAVVVVVMVVVLEAGGRVDAEVGVADGKEVG